MRPLCASIADYKAAARAALPAEIWAYLDGGSGVGRTRRDNERAFEAITLRPRPLADLRGGHTRTELFGRTLAHPLLLAPVAYQRLFDAQGEIGVAMAAAAQQIPFIVSSLASQPLADIAAAGADLWFQLYWQGEREPTLRLLRRAEAAGAQAIVFTVDAPIKQATLDLPEGISAVNLEPVTAPLPLPAGGSAVFDQWMAAAPRWEDLDWLRRQTQLPLLVKGLLHVDDGMRAVDAGCDGLVVSNHGGRIIDGTRTAIDALREFRQRLAPSLPLLFDSGIRSGQDAFKAIACGAQAVLVGRPYLWGLAAAGPMGVAHVIRLLRDELDMTMALTGCKTVASIANESQ
jgi:4-hydroxymandelate oxidase